MIHRVANVSKCHPMSFGVLKCPIKNKGFYFSLVLVMFYQSTTKYTKTGLFPKRK